jgi:iron complex outermembrane receptor protein
MKTLKLYQIAGSLLAVPALLILQTSKLFSQGEAQSDEEEIAVLSEFVVDAKSDSGYLAARAIAGLKTNTPIMELPINLKVLNREFLEDTNSWQVQDALRYVSNVGVGENRRDSVSIRGFGPSIQNDGLSFNTADRQRDMYPYERIEVIKGASAVLYSSRSLGGVINFIFKRPSAEPATEIFFEAGEHNHYRGGFDINRQLYKGEKGSINGRLVFSWEDSEGAKDLAFNERWIFMPMLEFNFSEKTSLLVRYSMQADDGRKNFACPAWHPSVPDEIPPEAQGRTHLGFGGIFLDLPPTCMRGDTRDKLKGQTHLFDTTFEHRFNSNWSMKLHTVYTNFNQDRIETFISNPGPQIQLWPRFIQEIPRDEDGINTEWNLVGNVKTGGISHKVLLGVQAHSRDWKGKNKRTALTPDFNIFAPVYGESRPNIDDDTTISGAFPPDGQVRSALRDTEHDQFVGGVFVQDQIGFFDDRLVVTAGMRYGWEDTTEVRVPGDRDNPTERVINSTFSDVYPRYAGIFNVTENISIFGGFSSTFAPASGRSDAQGNPLPQPTTEQFEIGTKLRVLNDRLFFSFSYFDYTRTNLIVPDVINIGNFETTGEIISDGYDVDFGFQVTDSFEIFGGVGWLDNVISKDTRPERVGRGFRGVPDFTAGIFGKYEFNEGGLEGLSITLGYSHVSERWGDANNAFKVPGYDWFQLGVRYKFAEHYEVALNIENLTDEEFFGTISSARFAQRGHPRWIKAKITARF